MERKVVKTLDEIDSEALDKMRERGGRWFAYQNQDLGHYELGHLQFLQCGENCTFKTPPDRMPDTHDKINWRYYIIGEVDLESGEVIELES